MFNFSCKHYNTKNIYNTIQCTANKSDKNVERHNYGYKENYL